MQTTKSKMQVEKPHVNYIEKYWEEIKSGRVRVSKKIVKQMKKLMKLLKESKNEIGQWVYNPKKADRPISFIENWCIHVEGKLSGKRVKLEIWEKAILQATFGFVSRKTGSRKYRELHLYVGRKNGKTLFAACIMIYLMFKDGELGAKCYSAATKREQAAISWNIAKLIINKGPLSSYFNCTVNGIYVKPYRDSLWQPLSKESKKLDGLNVHAGLIDELHAIVDSNLIEVIKDGQKSREQPLLIITTTMGIERQSTFDEVYDYDTNVLNGIYEDERKLIFCYELDAEKEWDDIDALQKANPNLGITQSIESLQDQIKEIKNDSSKLLNFLCKTCNLRQNNTTSWLSFDDINNETVYDLTQFDNSIVISGYDLSRTGDMTACNFMHFDKKTEKDIHDTMYWITNRFYKEFSKKSDIFTKWIAAGYVKLSGDNLINYHDVASYIMQKVQVNGLIIQKIQYDSYSAQYLTEELASYGFSKNYCLIPTQQGFKTLSIPMQTIEARLKQKVCCYQNNPVTKWCLTNVELEMDRNGNYMPRKGQDRYKKIDGFATMLNCYVAFCENMDMYLKE